MGVDHGLIEFLFAEGVEFCLGCLALLAQLVKLLMEEASICKRGHLMLRLQRHSFSLRSLSFNRLGLL